MPPSTARGSSADTELWLSAHMGQVAVCFGDCAATDWMLRFLVTQHLIRVTLPPSLQVSYHSLTNTVQCAMRQVFIRGGNWIASDWMLRFSVARYRTEVRMHAEVRKSLTSNSHASQSPALIKQLQNICRPRLLLRCPAAKYTTHKICQRMRVSLCVLAPCATSREQADARCGGAQAGLNMIRIWGGAAVARDAFYDACDEAGILVWPPPTSSMVLPEAQMKFLPSAKVEWLLTPQLLHATPRCVRAGRACHCIPRDT